MKSNLESKGISNDHYLTAGQLAEVVYGLPADTPIYYQRIEDIYFDKHGWKPDLLVPDDFEPSIREYDNQYVRAFCAFTYKINGKGKKHLCITAHY
jgi:hypothetical protein